MQALQADPDIVLAAAARDAAVLAFAAAEAGDPKFICRRFFAAQWPRPQRGEERQVCHGVGSSTRSPLWLPKPSSPVSPRQVTEHQPHGLRYAGSASGCKRRLAWHSSFYSGEDLRGDWGLWLKARKNGSRSLRPSFRARSRRLWREILRCSPLLPRRQGSAEQFRVDGQWAWATFRTSLHFEELRASREFMCLAAQRNGFALDYAASA